MFWFYWIFNRWRSSYAGQIYDLLGIRGLIDRDIIIINFKIVTKELRRFAEILHFQFGLDINQEVILC